jgi:threonine dehydrogenase-like Zn-dependent dehydrogenase
VVAVDKAVRVKAGDKVAVNCHITCGSCEHCIRGDLFFCKELTIVGFDINGGFEEFALIPESCLMPIPDDIDYETAALLVDMFGTGYRGTKMAGVLPGDQVAIWGAGPIGLTSLLTAKWLGAKVAILDFNPYRLKMAADLGADLVINLNEIGQPEILFEWTSGRGVDIAYECVGSSRAARQALQYIKYRGKLGMIGVSRSFEIDPWEDLIKREIVIYGSRCFVIPEFDQMLTMVRRGFPITRIVTHRFPIREAVQAFEVFRQGSCGKVVFINE